MTFSKEWKRILKEEVPMLRDTHDSSTENFTLWVPAHLVVELYRLAGGLRFTHSICMNSVSYRFRCDVIHNDGYSFDTESATRWYLEETKEAVGGQYYGQYYNNMGGYARKSEPFTICAWTTVQIGEIRTLKS